MSKPVVLIANATSRNGKQAAKQLLAQGKHFVRLTSRDPSKLAELVSQGAEAIALDPLSAESVTQACRGVDYVYPIIPVLAREAEATIFQNFLRAAHTTGVKHLLYLSSIEAMPEDTALYKPVHNHYEHEQQLLASGIPFTALRPGWFYENELSHHAAEIKHTGEFKTSAGDGVYASVAVQDVAAAAVVVLNQPGSHAGKIYPLTTDAISDATVAETVSKVTGQKVRHVNLTPEEHKELAMKDMPEEFAKRLVTLDYEKRLGLFSIVYPDLEQLLGCKGISLEDFIRQHVGAFKQA